MATTRPCSTPECDGEVPDKSQHNECVNCRAYHRRWSDRPTSDARERERILTVWSTRIHDHVKSKNGKNVVSITTSIRKRA